MRGITAVVACCSDRITARRVRHSSSEIEVIGLQFGSRRSNDNPFLVAPNEYQVGLLISKFL